MASVRLKKTVIPAALLLALLLLCACGAEPAGGQIDVAVGDTGAVCRLPDAFSLLRWGEGFMTLADKRQTATVSVTWRTDSVCEDLYSYLALEGLDTEKLVSIEEEQALYDLRESGEGLRWYLYRAPVAVKMTCQAETDSPWYDLNDSASVFFLTTSGASPESALVDGFLAQAAETLSALTPPETAQELTAAVETLFDDSLRQCVAWMEERGLLRYISSHGLGGLYLSPTDAGYDVGIYVGAYTGTLRQAESALWLTIQADGSRLYSCGWEEDVPRGSFSAASVTADYGSLLVFSGQCDRGVWDGEIALRYTDAEGKVLEGGFLCDAGKAPVERRSEDTFWNEDVNERFCYLSLTDGDETQIPLFRSWSDQYFVIRMAFETEALKHE